MDGGGLTFQLPNFHSIFVTSLIKLVNLPCRVVQPVIHNYSQMINLVTPPPTYSAWSCKSHRGSIKLPLVPFILHQCTSPNRLLTYFGHLNIDTTALYFHHISIFLLFFIFSWAFNSHGFCSLIAHYGKSNKELLRHEEFPILNVCQKKLEERGEREWRKKVIFRVFFRLSLHC